MRNSPSCNCCGTECVYSASDGNEYSDTFGSLDAGWLTNDASVAVVGNRLRVTSLTGTDPDGSYTYREVATSISNFLVIAEVDIFPSLSGTRSGCFLVLGDNGGNIADFEILSQVSDYTIVSFGTLYFGVGSTPADGDQITIALSDAGSGKIRACFFINGALVFSDMATWTLPNPLRYALGVGWDGASVTTEYDNFTIHYGNP